METRYTESSKTCTRCLKPTYEGWKREEMDLVGLETQRLKPTYEGWKQPTDTCRSRPFLPFEAYL